MRSVQLKDEITADSKTVTEMACVVIKTFGDENSSSEELGSRC